MGTGAWTVKRYITVLLLVAIGGALLLAATVGLTLWNLEQATETSGHASEDFQLVQTFLNNSYELLAVMDILTTESSGVFLVADRLAERCRNDLEKLRKSAMFSGTSLVNTVGDTFQRLVEKARKRRSPARAATKKGPSRSLMPLPRAMSASSTNCSRRPLLPRLSKLASWKRAAD